MNTQDLKNNRNEIIGYLTKNNVNVKKAMTVMIDLIENVNNWVELADLAIAAQKTVLHTKFGLGLIIENNEDSILIDFNGTIKKLYKMYANLQNIDGSKFEGRETNEERDARILSDNFCSPRYEHSTSLLKSFL